MKNVFVWIGVSIWGGPFVDNLSVAHAAPNPEPARVHFDAGSV